MPDRIRLLPNEPVTLKLVDPYADSCALYDPERCIGEYRTTDGRILALPRPAVLALAELDPKPGEEIGLCRDSKSRDIRMWLTASAEKDRAAQEASGVPSDELLLLEASVKRESARKHRNGTPTPIRKAPAPAEVPVQPRLFDRGTGTDGPAPQLAPAAIARPAIATKRVKYGELLAHIVRTVKGTLESEKLQLGDDPTQKIIVTLYIDASKQLRPEYDVRGAE